MNDMKISIQRLSLLVVFLGSIISASAYTEEIDGIYYNLSGTEAEVTSGYGHYSGVVVIPESVTYDGTTYRVTGIGDYAFNRCSELTSVTIPNSVTTIGKKAFYSCSGLTSVTIPNSVTTIGMEAFRYCSGLTSVTIPNGVESIGEVAFHGCTGLISVTIGSGVKTIGNGAFSSCSGLKKVIVEDIAAWCNISFGYYTANPLNNAGHLYSDENTEITDLVIPNGVTSIGDYAFYHCSGLTSVAIPNSVTSIGFFTFECCSNLTSITIPSSVTSIDKAAFQGCSGLTEITSQTKEPFPTTYCWAGVDKEIPLYVPVGTKELYAATEGWSEFTNIIERELASVERNNIVTYNDNAAINGIYTLQGVKVGDDAGALKQLPRGIYIVNGHKVAVK